METNKCLKNSISALWSIDDDTFFHAQGLLNHGAGCGQYVFVTWNENYLLNFVFNSSFTGGSSAKITSSISSNCNSSRSSLAKVRVVMPQYRNAKPNSELKMDYFEKIKQVLILEYNTLLLMHSGRVYYFSSVKSVHLVPWLKNVRCMAKAQNSTFSVIRCSKSNIMNSNEMGKLYNKLYLEVYRDVPSLGKYTTTRKLLLHSYDITFDESNLFECSWMDEQYLLNSFVVDHKNRLFFNKLAKLGQNFLKNNTIAVGSHNLRNDQLINNRVEVHLFSISCNLYMLYCADFIKIEALESNITQTFNPNSSLDYNIHLINLYQSPIKYIRIEENDELIIILLESGYIDLWYTSQIMQGVLTHQIVQILPYLQFDYCSSQRSFYFVSFSQVIQLQIIRKTSECQVQKIHKTITGMVACTWVEDLQQLVCLSCNNIFYRLVFNNLAITKTKQVSSTLFLENNDFVGNYEPLKNVHGLTDVRIHDLIKKQIILSNILQKPKIFKDKIQLEYQKQFLLSIAQNSKFIEKLFSAHIEYHLHTPTMEYFMDKYENIFPINIDFNNVGKLCEKNSNNIIEYNALIFIEISAKLLNSKRDAITAIFDSHYCCLQVSSKQQSTFVPLYLCTLKKMKICLILKCFTNCEWQILNKLILERFQLRLLIYTNHLRSHLLIEIPILIEYFHSKQLIHLFSNNFLKMLENSNKTETNLKRSCTTVDPIYKHKMCFCNIKDLSTISKEKPKLMELLTNEQLYYFWGVIPFKMVYSETANIVTILTNNTEIIFYFKVQCLLSIEAREDHNQVTSQAGELLQSYSDIKRLYGLLTHSKFNADNSTAIHWETLKNIYDKLRTTPLSRIYW